MTTSINVFSESVSQYLKYTEMPWGKLFYSTALAQMENYLKVENNSSVLDIGCGFGLTGISLAKKGCNVLGIEPNQDLLTVAKEKALKERVNVELRNLNITQLNSVDYKADFLICHNVLEYVENPEKAISDFADKTKDKGYISIITHNPHANVLKKAIVDKSPTKALSYIGNKTDYSSVIGADISLFSKEDIEEWLNKAGFKVVNRFGIHNLYGYIDNEFKFDAEWNKQAAELEMQVCNLSPYRDIAVFTHTIAQLA
ncbi:class I SAM-dependent methyltransferase [Heyndrickxia acidicola]|uniref:Methyltransferase domain-containing protein n=1 Tax=Heyndrickxia acidicola TaxID=209389 RepID=A0ABU6MJL3_9BACI|nr:class I SAM-dependent methyltransferase [Heyndrickxia acidicola]MED1203235.1 methyltransferase domain-containing protein [Heyndrickxia acidicola]